MSSGTRGFESHPRRHTPGFTLKNKQDITINQSGYIKRLYNQTAQASPENATIIYDFIIAQQSEINIKHSTKGDKIRKLCWLSKYLDHKSFKKTTKQDILSYFNSLRKPESEDPRHKWVGTYNGRQMVLLKFFRWLYDPDKPERSRVTPPCMKGIKTLPRREKSAYIPEDIWTTEDHVLFLRYCYTPRDRCWHSMVHDTSARPHELLKLKIKDVQFKLSTIAFR
jgi:integrase